MMKIAVLGEIHKDGWKVFENNKLESFELFNIDESNLKKELRKELKISKKDLSLVK